MKKWFLGRKKVSSSSSDNGRPKGNRARHQKKKEFDNIPQVVVSDDTRLKDVHKPERVLVMETCEVQTVSNTEAQRPITLMQAEHAPSGGDLYDRRESNGSDNSLLSPDAPAQDRRRRFSGAHNTVPEESQEAEGDPRKPQVLSFDSARTVSTFPRTKLENGSQTHLAPAPGGRRGSFIFRQTSKLSQTSISASSLLADASMDGNNKITPFNQTIQKLRMATAQIETNILKSLEDLYNTNEVHRSGAASTAGSDVSHDSSKEEGLLGQRLGDQIGALHAALQQLKCCCIELEEMGGQGRTVGQFAAQRFGKLLSEEVKEQPNVAQWISSMFTHSNESHPGTGTAHSPSPRNSIPSYKPHGIPSHGIPHDLVSPGIKHSYSLPAGSSLASMAAANHVVPNSLLPTTSDTRHAQLSIIESVSEHSTPSSDEPDMGAPAITPSQLVSCTFANDAGLCECSDPEKMLEELNAINCFQFDMFQMAHVTYDRPFVPVVMALFKEWNLLPDLEIEEPVMVNYLTEIEHLYLPNPYHNSWHGADVAQTAHILILKAGLEKYLSRLDIFAVLLSAAVHDVGHVGFNNDFLVRTRHELALLYNDQSVLENMHASQAISLAENPKKDCNIFKNFSRDEYTELRSAIIKLVLATDPKKHVDMLGIFTSFVESYGMDSGGVNDSQQSQDNQVIVTEKSLVLETLLHSADISNPCKPHSTSMAWTERVIEEFHAQGDKEKQAGFTPLKIFDRESDSKVHDMQIGFIRGIVQPQWEAWDMFCKRVAMTAFEDPLEYLYSNLQHWESLKAQDTAVQETKSTASSTDAALKPLPLSIPSREEGNEEEEEMPEDLLTPTQLPVQSTV